MSQWLKRALSLIGKALEAEVRVIGEGDPCSSAGIVSQASGPDSVRLAAERTARPFTDADQAFLDAAAGLLALAMEQQRENEASQRRVEELASREADFQELTHAVSHDLQEPLRTVSSFAQFLSTRHGDSLGPEAAEFLGYIREGAARMSRLIQDMTRYVQAARPSGPITATSSESALRWALTNLQPAIRDSAASVTYEGLPVVPASAAQLAEVFQNLVGNAIQFRSQEPPRIHVAAERMGAEWRFTVNDNGSGVDPRYAARIFGAFTRLHGREHPGSGIGLAICRRIVERHGGRIWVEQGAGGGASFRFTLPAG